MNRVLFWQASPKLICWGSAHVHGPELGIQIQKELLQALQSIPDLLG